MTADSTVLTRIGDAHLVELSDLERVEAWRMVSLGGRHDSRYYEILDGSVPPFEYHYLILTDSNGHVRAIQPVFVSVQDVLEGVSEQTRIVAGLLRRISPNRGNFRTLWVGASVGESALGAGPRDQAWCARALTQALPWAAERLEASMIVLKDFPSALRPVLQPFVGAGYTRIPSMPSVELDLDFGGFDGLVRRLGRDTRRDLRRKFRDADRYPPVSVEVRNDISDRVDELYPLYLQVHERSRLSFERLTPDYFRRLGREMSDRARFFIWSQEGRPIAFDACFVHDGVLSTDALGMDYRVALDLHLYFIVNRDVIDWACRNGIRRLVGGQLNYDPKLLMGYRLRPLDLYVWHRSRVMNGILRRAAPRMTPARREPLLPKFPLAARIFLDERTEARSWIGVAMITSGMIIVGMSSV